MCATSWCLICHDFSLIHMDRNMFPLKTKTYRKFVLCVPPKNTDIAKNFLRKYSHMTVFPNSWKIGRTTAAAGG